MNVECLYEYELLVQSAKYFIKVYHFDTKKKIANISKLHTRYLLFYRRPLSHRIMRGYKTYRKHKLFKNKRYDRNTDKVKYVQEWKRGIRTLIHDP